MANFRVIGGEKDQKFEMIYATHPALPNTYIVYVDQGEPSSQENVVLWGVLADGSAVPITLNGVWDGTEQDNRFVMFPDGRCAQFEHSWINLGEAITEIGKRSR